MGRRLRSCTRASTYALLSRKSAQLPEVSLQLTTARPAVKMVPLHSNSTSDELWEKSGETEGSTLLGQGVKFQGRITWVRSNLHTIMLYSSNFMLLGIIGILSTQLKRLSGVDPSIQIYCTTHGPESYKLMPDVRNSSSERRRRMVSSAQIPVGAFQ